MPKKRSRGCAALKKSAAAKKKRKELKEENNDDTATPTPTPTPTPKPRLSRAQRAAQLRERETPAARQDRLARDRERHAEARANERAEQAEARLEADAVQHARARANETEEEREARLEADAMQHSQARANETEEDREARLEADAMQHSQARANETEEEMEARLDAQVDRQTRLLADETEEEEEARLEADAARHAEARANETPEQAEARLARQRARFHSAHMSARSRPDLPNNLPPLFNVGNLTITCPHCLSLSFKGDSFKCCHKGKVDIPLYEFPPALQALYTEDTPEGRNFRKFLRRYNTLFSFASRSVNEAVIPGSNSAHNHNICRISGQIHHRIGSLYPPNRKTPSFQQLYIIENHEEANSLRMENPISAGCSAVVMEIISVTLHQVNPFIPALITMHECIIEENELAQNEGRQPVHVRLHLRNGPDRRRYNEPTQREVAAIFTGEDGAVDVPTDIIIYPRNNRRYIKELSIYSPNASPLCFPLLFPSGEPGWEPGIPHVAEFATSKRKTVTCLQYETFLWAIREDHFNPLHHAKLLAQHYIVDAYVRVESHRLAHQRKRQSDLRVDSLNGLNDFISGSVNEPPSPDDTGRPVILSSSFQGSPRQMAESYQDALAICRANGNKADLFITFTCNTQWSEITDQLQPGQTPDDRPDLLARVFKIKLKELMKDLTVKCVLGKTFGHVYVVEFQKRGYPHAHILIHFQEEDRIQTPQHIDSIISAEIPDPDIYPELHQLVCAKMMHGPCGTDNPNNVCMDKGQCTKSFPKPFQAETAMTDSYPTYKRPDNGRTVVIKGATLDNRWVVPYNPYLLSKYGAHINVEAVSSIGCLKYMHKYVHKGHDSAEVGFVVDEIETFINARYVSAPEAAYRLFEFPLHGKSHSVVKLPIHLSNKQSVFFRRGEEAAAVEKALNKDTHLTAWFKLNTTDPSARQFYYEQIPLHYKWNDKTFKWVRRKKAWKVVPRLVSVSPRDIERYHLRVLLLMVPGATSYEYLRTSADGTVCSTFLEACNKRHLLDNDTAWVATLTDAVNSQSPKQIRRLFAYMLLYCNISDPVMLFTQFYADFFEDYLLHLPEDQASQKALSKIEAILNQNGSTLTNFGLPAAHYVNPVIPPLNPGDLPFDLGEEGEKAAQFTLNVEQKRAAHYILTACLDTESPGPHLFFLCGPGGSGKTYLYNYLVHKLRSLSDENVVREG